MASDATFDQSPNFLPFSHRKNLFYCIFKQQFFKNMAKMLLFPQMANFLPFFYQNVSYS